MTLALYKQQLDLLHAQLYTLDTQLQALMEIKLLSVAEEKQVTALEACGEILDRAANEVFALILTCYPTFILRGMRHLINNGKLGKHTIVHYLLCEEKSDYDDPITLDLVQFDDGVTLDQLQAEYPTCDISLSSVTIDQWKQNLKHL